jgi:RNA polymerase sigma-70 factor (ECF subfamily)
MDQAFFEQMAMPLFDQLYNFAHWLTGDRSDAEDLVQETFAKALKGFRSFEEGTNLRAWMYRILRNSYLTSKSGLAAQRTSSLEDDEEQGLTAHSITPESLLLRKESYATVSDALEALPAPYREIVLLCEVEELSYREMAQVLCVPIGTVMSRLARARKLLRQAVAVPVAKEVER